MWYIKSMAVKTKTPKQSGTYTIGRSGFAKISEVEGIQQSRRLEDDFREFERQGLSAAERRRILRNKYGRKV
jgi:hypothetical protein